MTLSKSHLGAHWAVVLPSDRNPVANQIEPNFEHLEPQQSSLTM